MSKMLLVKGTKKLFNDELVEYVNHHISDAIHNNQYKIQLVFENDTIRGNVQKKLKDLGHRIIGNSYSHGPTLYTLGSIPLSYEHLYILSVGIKGINHRNTFITEIRKRKIM